jgi:hypothetical protein
VSVGHREAEGGGGGEGGRGRGGDEGEEGEKLVLTLNSEGGEDVTSVSLSSCAQLGTILLVVARSATLGAGSYCNIFRFGMVTTYPTTRGVTPCCRRDCFNMPCPATWGPSLLWPLQLRKQALCSVKRQAKQAEVQPTPSPPRLLVGLGVRVLDPRPPTIGTR